MGAIRSRKSSAHASSAVAIVAVRRRRERVGGARRRAVGRGRRRREREGARQVILQGAESVEDLLVAEHQGGITTGHIVEQVGVNP